MTSRSPARESWRRDPRPGLLVVLAGLALAGFAVLTVMLLLEAPFVRFDQSVSAWFRSFASPGLDAFARALTFVGSTVGMTILVAATGAWYLTRRRRAEALLLALTVGFGTALGHVAKALVHRIRPALEYARIPQPESYSFPSGHALASFLFFGVLVFIVVTAEEDLSLKAKAALAALFVAVGLAVALSRVYLGVHYLGDIIGAWLLGSAILTVAVGVYTVAVTERPAE
jgi:undecaprenyl-diphosphatase